MVGVRSMLLASLCLAPVTGPAQARDFQATTSAGRPVRVLVQAAWHRDCTVDAPPQVTVTMPPANGSVVLGPSRTTIVHADAGGEQCIGRPVRGVGVFYRPQGGFRGTDRFRIAVAFPNGVVLTHDATVVVR